MWTFTLVPAVAQVSVEAPSTGSFHDELSTAKQLLFEGRTADALAIFDALAARLEGGERPPLSLANEALVYRGDVQFTQGDPAAARASFRRVLEAVPDYTVSPYHHGEDVRALFALVREQVQQEIASRPPEILPQPPVEPRRRRLPLWGYAPLGLPQFNQGRPGAGAAHLTVQSLFAAASIGSYTWIVVVNRNPEGHPFGWDEEKLARRVQTMRFGAQLPSTALFYGAWLISSLDGAGTWRREQRSKTGVRVGLAPNGFVVSGNL